MYSLVKHAVLIAVLLLNLRRGNAALYIVIQ